MRFVASLAVFLALLAAVLLLRGTVLFIARWWVFIVAALGAGLVGSWVRAHGGRSS